MIIGISGKMGTGKTTLADMLVDRLGGKRESFASALRREVSELFGIPESLLGDREYKERGKVTVGNRIISPRQLMQWWGGIRRDGNLNYWVNQTVRKDVEPYMVIDDVRYWNEAEVIKKRDGILIRLEPYDDWQSGSGPDHASETELDGYPATLTFYPQYGELSKVADKVADFVKLK